MAKAMKTWHITVMANGIKQVACIPCVSAGSATEKMAAAKEKYIDVAPDPTATDPALQKGIKYSFYREQF